MGLDDISDQNAHSIAERLSGVLTCGNVSFHGPQRWLMLDILTFCQGRTQSHVVHD